jgi:acetyltransferase-like isoleucine patch superfamily enzyme
MSSIISDTATIGSDSTLGHFCVIGAHVSIGSGCRIGHHVVIHDDTIVGDGCVIDDHAVLGKRPLHSRSMAIEPNRDLAPLSLADRVVVGTGAILFAGSSIGEDSLVADLASVREQTQIGRKTIIGRGVAVENKVVIGDRCKIEAGAFICAFTHIADDCFIAPEVTLTNDNFMGRMEERKKHFAGATIEKGGRIGANATVLPGKTVCEEGVAAAGSVVTKNVPTHRIVAGVPAREIADVPEEQLLG